MNTVAHRAQQSIPYVTFTSARARHSAISSTQPPVSCRTSALSQPCTDPAPAALFVPFMQAVPPLPRGQSVYPDPFPWEKDHLFNSRICNAHVHTAAHTVHLCRSAKQAHISCSWCASLPGSPSYPPRRNCRTRAPISSLAHVSAAEHTLSQIAHTAATHPGASDPRIRGRSFGGIPLNRTDKTVLGCVL